MMPLDGRFDVEPPMTPELAQQGAALLIDGVPVGRMGFHLVDADLGSADISTSYIDVPGTAGGIDSSMEDECGCAYQGRRTALFTLRTFAPAHLRAAGRLTLGAYAGKRVGVLYRPLGLELRGRLSVGSWDDHRAWADVELSLSADPIMLGETTVWPVSDGCNAIEVGGNAPCPLSLYLRNGGGSTIHAIRATVDGGKSLQLESRSAIVTGIQDLIIDCERMTCSIGGNDSIAPTIDSDWLVVPPGGHVVELSVVDGYSQSLVGRIEATDRWRM